MMSMRGQSLVEFALAAGFLAALLIGMEALSGWFELQRRTISAARQGAFVRVWRPHADLNEFGAEVFADQFDDPGLVSPVLGEPLIGSEDLRFEVVNASLRGAAATAQGLLRSALQAQGSMGSDFDWGTEGLLGAQIRVRHRRLSELPDPLDRLGPEFVERMLLLEDGWSASGPDQVSVRAGALVPTRMLRPLSVALAPLSVPLALLEPSLPRLCLGLIDADGVPEDRLSVRRTARPTWNSCR